MHGTSRRYAAKLNPIVIARDHRVSQDVKRDFQRVVSQLSAVRAALAKDGRVAVSDVNLSPVDEIRREVDKANAARAEQERSHIRSEAAKKGWETRSANEAERAAAADAAARADQAETAKRSEAAKKGWETRRANEAERAAAADAEARAEQAETAKRSEAAKKGWETRRANDAAKQAADARASVEAVRRAAESKRAADEAAAWQQQQQVAEATAARQGWYGAGAAAGYHESRGSANGRELHVGPKGGTFYYTNSGKKRYV
jgi:colicin import membrane protein